MASSIHTHRWAPNPNATAKPYGVYILHGIGEHAGRHERLAMHLSELGYAVGAHDHPGHGKSAGERGVITSFDELELTAADQLAKFEQEIGKPAFLFGHSLGGLVAASMVLNHQVVVPGLLLSAPAFTPMVSTFNKIKLSVLNLIAPHFSQELPYNAEHLTHDKEEQIKAVNDTLNHRYKSVGIVMWLIKNGEHTLSRANELTMPTLVLVPTADVVVDPRAAAQFSDAVKDELVTKNDYEGFRHEILNETPERRSRVLADIEQWLETQIT